jgi:hypothetical protein
MFNSEHLGIDFGQLRCFKTPPQILRISLDDVEKSREEALCAGILVRVRKPTSPIIRTMIVLTSPTEFEGSQSISNFPPFRVLTASFMLMLCQVLRLDLSDVTGTIFCCSCSSRKKLKIAPIMAVPVITVSVMDQRWKLDEGLQRVRGNTVQSC